MENFLKDNYYAVIYTSFFICATVFSFLVNSLFLRFFHTLGIRNNNDGTVIRWGALSKPAVGGLTFYILFLLSIACYAMLFNTSSALYNIKFLGTLLAMGIGFLIGLADDAYNTKPFLKFFGQLSCAVILIACGIYIPICSHLYINYLFTIFWVVGIMNSINMLDNMDGITATVSTFIVVACITIILLNHDFNNMHLLALLGVLASLLGFLYFNWNPSKMYMGDTGSQFLGVFLATMGIMYLWNDYYVRESEYSAKQIFTAVTAFILPIVDTTVVVINRLSKKKSPFVGGKDHTTHSLAYLGFSDRMVALCFAGLSCFSLLLIFVIHEFIHTWSSTFSVIFGAYFLLLLSFFFYTTRRKIDSQSVKQEKLHPELKASTATP